MGALGDLYTLPFKAVNLPFRGLRQRYGKPRKDEKYTGNIIQKTRLKKLVPQILNGEELNEKDRLFMNMFNDFLTGEGNNPVDQLNVKMKCEDCKPYLYKRRAVPISNEEEPEEEETSKKEIISYKIKFNDELKPKNSSKTFKEGNIYGFSFLGKKNISGRIELYFKNSFLDKHDYLIFVPNSEEFVGIVKHFDVYQNNSKNPLRIPTFLGSVNAKIY